MDPWLGDRVQERIPLHRKLRWPLRSMLFIGLALMFMDPALGGICLGLWVLAIFVFGVGEIVYIFFRRAQLRLTELLFIIVVLGNIWGLTLKWISWAVSPSVPLGVMVGIGLVCTIWILGGSAWGLWVATVLNRDRAWDRIKLLVLGWVGPLAIVGIAPFLLGTLGSVVSGEFLLALCLCTLSAISVYVILTAWRLNAAAKVVDYSDLIRKTELDVTSEESEVADKDQSSGDADGTERAVSEDASGGSETP